MQQLPLQKVHKVKHNMLAAFKDPTFKAKSHSSYYPTNIITFAFFFCASTSSINYHSKMTILPGLMFLLALLTNPGQMVFAKGSKTNVREACSVTRFQSLCVHSLAQFSNTAGRSPSKWARAGVSVSIGEVKNVQAYLAQLKRHGHMKGRNKVALSDCVESFAYALDELHRSLGVLRRLSKTTFSTQMGDLNTWISAALTDEETCLEGFEGKKQKQVKLLQNRVQNASYITSNALALVNKLATTGLGSINDPYKF